MNKTFAFIIAIFMSSALVIEAANPDFAYPKTVLETATANYNRAIKQPTADGISLIESILQIIGATEAIDPDSVPSAMTYVDRAIEAKTDAPTDAILLLVKASLLNKIYAQSQWRFDRLDTPDEPLPSDIKQWNGRQFKSQINLYADRAFRSIIECAPIPIDHYKSIILIDSNSAPYFPSLQDFIALKADGLISETTNNEGRNRFASEMAEASINGSPAWFYWNVAILPSDFNYLINLYDSHPDSEAAGYVLQTICSNIAFGNEVRDRQIIERLRDFIGRYPEYSDIARLQNALMQLTQATVNLEMPSLAATGKQLKIKASYKYATTFGYDLYFLEANRPNMGDVYRRIKSSKAVASASFNVPKGEEIGDSVFEVTLNRTGAWVIVPKVNGIGNISNYSIVYCTPFVATLVKEGNNSTIAVADITSGAPMRDIKVTRYIGDKPTYVGKTDKSGLIRLTDASLPDKRRWADVQFVFQSESVSICLPQVRDFIDVSNPQTPELRASIITERDVFHRGDSIAWSAIIYQSAVDEKDCTTLSRSVDVYLINPNYQTVDSISATSDNLGQINGRFLAPLTGLTGNYTIRIRTPKDENGENLYIASKWITVSDFKLPTFTVDSLVALRDTPQKGYISIQGTAMTFSGMPVANAKVDAEIFTSQRFWWSARNQRVATLSATTDATGSFQIIVADSITSGADADFFVAEIAVASQAGESQNASIAFCTGKPYGIVGNSAVNKFDTDKPFVLDFKAVDASGKTADIDLKWELLDKKEDSAVESGNFRSGSKPTLNFSGVASGTYLLTISPVDTLLADTVTAWSQLELYSLKKNTMPTDNPIFVPETAYTTDADGQVDILVGTPCDDTYLNMSFATPGKLDRIECKTFASGFQHIKYKMPTDAKVASLIVFTTRDCRVVSQRIEIKRPDKRIMHLSGSAMRDRLTPGSGERWTLRLTDADIHAVRGGLIATMFNSALQQLSPYSFPQDLYCPTPYSNQNIRAQWLSSLRSSVSAPYHTLAVKQFILPTFNPDVFQQAFMIRDAIQYNMAAGRVYDTASPMMSKATMMATADAEETETEEATVASGPDDRGPQTTAVKFRPAEVLQAFWMPDLEFDSNGEATLSFTVPDVVGAWSMYAFAWCADLRSATLLRDFIAAKPVMVEPNMPRFLRQGDRPVLRATVFNNADTIAAITTTFELFDINDGRILATTTSTDSIAAGLSAVASATFDTPTDVSAIGYRIFTTNGEFTDAIQDMIAVESARSDVIDSQIVYLNPGDADCSIKIPKTKNSQIVLDFTSNPAWNIIKQLPALSTTSSVTAYGAVNRLFSAATSAGLLKSNPEIADVLKAWLDDPDCKALRSRLEQNDNLKAAILNETPWVQAASADNLRMARLALLFDDDAVNSTLDGAITTLEKLQCNNGGWAWGEWSRDASTWATAGVLLKLAQLQAIGYLPADSRLKKMMSSAVNYYVSQIDDKVKDDITLAMIKALIPDVKLNERGRQLVDGAVKRLASEWKKLPTPRKAEAVIILYRLGRVSEAKQIIESIDQFAVSSADHGVSFPSLTRIDDYADLLFAYSLVNPASALIDGMRQWLVIESQAKSRLTNCDPTKLIAAFALSGSPWLTSATSEPIISLGDNVLQLDDVEKATGHIVMNISASKGEKSLHISRKDAATPAYGAIISRYCAPSTEVKAASTPDLSISKRFAVLRDGRWQYADEARLGEQVRVFYLIEAKRDMQYVSIIDNRCAALEPVDKLPGYTVSDAARFYRQNLDSQTSLFIDRLPKGTYQIAIDMTAACEGSFTGGIATVQSQLDPALTAHTAGMSLVVQ